MALCLPLTPNRELNKPPEGLAVGLEPPMTMREESWLRFDINNRSRLALQTNVPALLAAINVAPFQPQLLKLAVKAGDCGIVTCRGYRTNVSARPPEMRKIPS